MLLLCLVALLFTDPSSCFFPWTGIPAVRQEAVIICAGHRCLGVALIMRNDHLIRTTGASNVEFVE